MLVFGRPRRRIPPEPELILAPQSRLGALTRERDICEVKVELLMFLRRTDFNALKRELEVIEIERRFPPNDDDHLQIRLNAINIIFYLCTTPLSFLQASAVREVLLVYSSRPYAVPKLWNFPGGWVAKSQLNRQRVWFDSRDPELVTAESTWIHRGVEVDASWIVEFRRARFPTRRPRGGIRIDLTRQMFEIWAETQISGPRWDSTYHWY